MFVFSQIAGYLLRFLMQLFNNNYMLAIVLFTVITSLALKPLEILGEKKSRKYAQLKPEIDKIKNSGGDVHQVEKDLTELYDKNGVKFRNVIINPLTIFISLLIMSGFIAAIMNPLRYIVGLTAEQIVEVNNLMAQTAQTSYFGLASSCGDALNGILSPDMLLRFTNYANSLNIGGFDFGRVPNATYLLWLPIVALAIRLLQIGLSQLYSYIAYKKISKGSLIESLIFFALFAPLTFSIPAGFSFYFITSTVVAIVFNLISFGRNFSKFKKNLPEKESDTSVVYKKNE